MSGWLRLWRQLREHQFWQEPRRFSKAEAWLDLLMDTAYAEHDAVLGNTVVHVQRGQALISQRTKAVRWGWARNTVHSFIRLLAKLEMASHEVSRGPEGGYTLITIRNYEKFQGLDEQDSLDQLRHAPRHALSHDRATIEPRLEQSEEREEGKRRKKDGAAASGLTLAEYLQGHTPEGQEILRQVVHSLASTRKSGKVAPSVVNAQATKWSRFPAAVVLTACRIYLDRRYAEEGKSEAYLLGIIRQEAKRSNGHGGHAHDGQEAGRVPTPLPPAPMTAGQRAIARALADLRTAQEPGR